MQLLTQVEVLEKINNSESFKGFEIGDIDFSNFTFENDVNFSGAKFTGEADFGGATFKGEADFSRAKFEKIADFSRAKFMGEADYRETTFEDKASFTQSKFKGNAKFSEAMFKKNAKFSGAMFEKDANFIGSKFFTDFSIDHDSRDKIARNTGNYENENKPVFESGYLNFESPDKMKVGIESRVMVEIYGQDYILDLMKDKTNMESIKVSSVMKAKLSGDDFEIASLNNESQVILKEDKTIWNWNVKPIKSGKKHLILVVSVTIQIPETVGALKDIPIYERIINVKINFPFVTKKFIEKNWQWLVGTLIGTGTIWSILKLFKIIE